MHRCLAAREPAQDAAAAVTPFAPPTPQARNRRDRKEKRGRVHATTCAEALRRSRGE
jgi:hypothetical protein